MKIKVMSGSIYEIEFDKDMGRPGSGGRVRCLVAGEGEKTKRITDEWRDFLELHTNGFGCMLFVWGTGEDAASATATQVGEPSEDTIHVRTTMTPPIIGFEDETGEWVERGAY